MLDRNEYKHQVKLLTLQLQNLMVLEEAQASQPEVSHWKPQRRDLMEQINRVADKLNLAQYERGTIALIRFTKLEQQYASSLERQARSIREYRQDLEEMDAIDRTPSRVRLLERARQYEEQITNQQAILLNSEIDQGDTQPLIIEDVNITNSQYPAPLIHDGCAENTTIDQAIKHQADILISALRRIAPGHAYAVAYQQHMLQVLSFLFQNDLTSGKTEEATFDGTERRDIIFTNQAEASFWRYIREQYGNYLVMFEAKNVQQLENDHINQVNAYLGDRIGRLGFIITRNLPNGTRIRKTMSIFNDSQPRKVILILHDEDIQKMLTIKANSRDPTEHIQQIYRKFKLQLQ